MQRWPRRRLLAALAVPALSRLAPARAAAVPAQPALAAPATQAARLPLAFPADFGAHPRSRIEWWYVTGWLAAAAAVPALPQLGFQVTLFRARTAVPADHPSAFAATQAMVGHAAITELAHAAAGSADSAGRYLMDQRAARVGFGIADAATGDARLKLRDWRLERRSGGTAGVYDAHVTASTFALELALSTTQPPLLHGASGWTRKGPQPTEANYYYSHPQLAVQGRVTLHGQVQAVHGKAWFDQEWSDGLMPEGAVGWDWIGMNLDDGSALMAIRMRRADGSVLWTAGSWRRAGVPEVRSFAAQELLFTPLHHWTSPITGAVYPLEWQLQTPVGRFSVHALLDAQELDSRASVGAAYWEGLSELRDGSGQRVGWGYLELTGYHRPMRLGWESRRQTRHMG